MFRVDTSLPDPDILKLRFRRRFFFLTLLGALLLLTVPVLRDRLPALRAHKEARVLAERLLDMRLLAQQNKAASAIELLNTKQAWSLLEFGTRSNCDGNEAMAPRQQIEAVGLRWRLVQTDANGAQTKDIERICFHPLLGVLADSVPLKDQDLSIVVGPSADSETGRQDRLRQISIQKQGDELGLAI